VLAAKGYAVDHDAAKRAGALRLLCRQTALTLRTWARRALNAVSYARSGKLMWRIRVVLNSWKA